MQLQERQADLSLGSFQQTPQRSLLITNTISHYQTAWVVVTLRDAYILNSFEIFLYPFTTSTWFLLAVMNIFALLVATLLRRIFQTTLLKNLDYVPLDIVAMLLGMPAQYQPVFQSSRMLNATWLLYGIILRTTYQALLFHLIRTNVTRDMPVTLEELVQQNYSLVMEPASFQILKKMVIFETIKYIRLNKSQETMPLLYLENLTLSQARYIAATVPLIFYQYYVNQNYKADVFKVIPQSIMNQKLGIYLSKHSFLSDRLNEVIKMLRGFGIVHFWYQQEVDINYVTNEHAEANNIIGLKHLEMPFKLLVMGYIMGILIFIMELWFRRFKVRSCLRKCLKGNRI